jgi:16S rRNA (uracil1498-N3)-methyltransferase
VSWARLFVERLPGAGESLRLSAPEAAHGRALRLSAGDPVVLFDGSGREALAHVSGVSRAGVEVLAERSLEPAVPGPPLTLYISGVRAQRLAWIAEKATELGTSGIVLLRSERTQSFRAGEALRDRLERVARAAAKQCGAPRWPQIAGPLPIREALARESSTHRLFLDPEGAPFPRALSADAAALAVGPEGGWTAAEAGSARGLGWAATALPAGRLRTETAAIAGLVLARAALERKA